MRRELPWSTFKQSDNSNTEEFPSNSSLFLTYYGWLIQGKDWTHNKRIPCEIEN